MLRLHPGTVDYIIIAIYFAVVLGIGFVARLAIKTDLDFFLSGRSLPALETFRVHLAARNSAAHPSWATFIAALPAQDTSSRWSTTASSTA